MNCPRTTARPGYLLLEMVLALAVFGTAATGFAVALHKMGQAASLAQSELQITRIIDSALEETLSLPVLEEGETNSSVGDTGIELDTTIELLDEMQTQDGQLLQEMYHIQIDATWFANGDWQHRTVETWRYGRMYQP